MNSKWKEIGNLILMIHREASLYSATLEEPCPQFEIAV
jgi:hypothetical protein